MKKIEIFLGIIVAISLSIICTRVFEHIRIGTKEEYIEEAKQIINKMNEPIVIDLSSEEQPQIEEAKQVIATIEGEEVKNKYYYNQLDEYGKIIYSGLYKNKENLKTGTYDIDFDTQFSQLLNQTVGQEILNTSFQSALDAFLYDNVDMYYLDARKMVMQTESKTIANITVHRVKLGKGNNDNYLISTIGNKEALNIATTRLEQIKSNILKQCEGKDVYEQLKIVHDWIVDNINYDQTKRKRKYT